MMLRWTKIGSALLAGSAMALMATGSGGPAAAAGTAGFRFSAPVQPLILTRELRRPIGKAGEIVSRRSYRIQFVREGAGWRVDGELVSSEVDAPAELSALAALEKARKDLGLFPLRLDAAGLIVDQPGANDPAVSAQARGLVNGAVEKISMALADKSLAGGMVGQISTQAQAVGGNWPTDLFNPARARHTEVRNSALPDGRNGRVTVMLEANRDSSGQLELFERRVLTELDGSSRLSRETWRLAAQP